MADQRTPNEKTKHDAASQPPDAVAIENTASQKWPREATKSFQESTQEPGSQKAQDGSETALPPPAGDPSASSTKASEQRSEDAVDLKDGMSLENEANESGQGEQDEDPSDPIAPFDWEDIESRYHQAMNQQDQKEQEIYKEFDTLINFFQQWVNASRVHEVDRTYKRLRTRMRHVHHSEDDLEHSQQHYQRVVAAFQNALNLLNGR